MEDCANLYFHFQEQLGRYFTMPTGSLSLTRFCLVEMFTSCTDDDIKEEISLFTKESTLCIVCVIIAFGMGVDCKDVSSIIHVGPPDDISSYVQETAGLGVMGENKWTNNETVLFHCQTIRLSYSIAWQECSKYSLKCLDGVFMTC